MKSPEQIYGDIEKKLKAGFLSQTVIEVVQNITSKLIAEVRAGDAENSLFCESYVLSILFMTGPLNMALIIGMPKQDACEFLSDLTGIEAEEVPDENMCDLVNEITNMVSGRIKALLNQIGYIYTNSHAFNIFGEDYNVFHRSKIKSIIKKYRTGDMEINLRILFL